MSATPIGSEFRVNTLTAGKQFDSAIALDEDGDFIVTWYSRYGSNEAEQRIFAQRYNSNGDNEGLGFVVASEFSNDGGALGAPDIATDAVGNFTVVWQNRDDDSFPLDNDGFGVIGQRYNANGSTDGDDVRVNTSTTGDQDLPAIAMTRDGDYVVTWRSVTRDNFGNPVDYRIYAQRYDEDGDAQGSQITVASLGTSDTRNLLSKPDVAIAEDGSFVITWESRNASDAGDRSGLAVYAQRFESDGDTDGSRFRVNTYTLGDQNRPAIAMDDDGNFVIAWESTGQDGDDDGIFARRYSNTGNAIDKKEFQVNVFEDDNQWGPDIALDNDGNILVAWSSEDQDGSGYGIYARTYTRNLQASREFRVNSFTRGDQYDPAVALNEDGDAVISWTSAGQDGSDYGVYAQRFSLAGGATDGDDNLVGTAGDDVISGLRGNDRIVGKNGNDTLNGDQGNDLLKGSNGRDKLNGGSGRDDLQGEGGNDKLNGGSSNDTLLGGDGNDSLVGLSGDDVLDGGKNDDTLNGGKGKNTLIGDLGRDLFLLVEGGFAQILDFQDGKDKLGIAGNFLYRDLDISGKNGSTIITLNDARIAQLRGVDDSLIDKKDFSL